MDHAEETPRDLGEQPIARRLRAAGHSPRDLVRASTEQLTHKMVARACRGRRLTPNVQGKLQRAWNSLTGEDCALDDLFDYHCPGGPSGASE